MSATLKQDAELLMVRNTRMMKKVKQRTRKVILIAKALPRKLWAGNLWNPSYFVATVR